MENPIKMDDLGVPLFSETSVYQSHGSVMGIGALALGPMMENKQNPFGRGSPYLEDYPIIPDSSWLVTMFSKSPK